MLVSALPLGFVDPGIEQKMMVMNRRYHDG